MDFSLPGNLRKRFARPRRSLDQALHFPKFHASFPRPADARRGKRFHCRRRQEHRAELRSDPARLGGKFPPRLAPLCRSLRRTFPANVAILPAQLCGRISRAQSACLFDSLFERRNRHCEWCPRPERDRVLIAHGSSRAERAPLTLAPVALNTYTSRNMTKITLALIALLPF